MQVSSAENFGHEGNECKKLLIQIKNKSGPRVDLRGVHSLIYKSRTVLSKPMQHIFLEYFIIINVMRAANLYFLQSVLAYFLYNGFNLATLHSSGKRVSCVEA